MARVILVLCLLAYFVSSAGSTGPADTELFYCVDWDCQEFISRGKTLLKYSGRTEKHLSFRQNEDIKILSKPFEENGADWVGMIQRKIGLVPKTMVREDQMGKHPSKFQYPFNVLPLWKAQTDGGGQKPDVLPEKLKQSEQEESKAEDGHSTNSTLVDVKTNTSTADDTEGNSAKVTDDASTSIETKQESVPVVVVPEITSEGTVLPDDFDDEGPQSVEPISDVADPSQTTVMPDELQKQEQIEPTETTDQEIPEATAVNEEQKEYAPEETTSDLPVPKESLEIESQTEAPLQEEMTSELSTHLKESDKSENTASESPLAESLESPNSSDVLQDKPPKEEIVHLKATEGSVSQTKPTLHQEKEVTSEPTVQPVEPLKSEEVVPQLSVDETVQSEKSSVVLDDETQEEKIVKTTTTSVPDITVDIPDQEPQDESGTPTESSIFSSGWFGSPVEEPVTPPAPEIQESVVPVTQLKLEDTPKEDMAGGTFPDETAEEPGSFANWFQETAKLTESNLHPETVQTPEEKAIDDEKVDIKSESESTLREETTSELPVQAQGIKSEEVILEFLATEKPATVALDESKQAEIVETTTTPVAVPDSSDVTDTTVLSEPELQLHEDDPHHHHHHHHHEHKKSDDSSSFIAIVKHLSSTLLSFLPKHLQDTILDVDDTLVFAGIIALALVSICVPYFLIEGFFSVRPLKKNLTELKRSLWKVSTAYENQQEEFEVYKKKALAYDEDKKRVEQLEYELLLLKKLESQQKEQVTSLKKELKSSAQVAEEVQSLVETTMDRKKKALEEREKLKTTVASLKEALRRTTDELQEAQAEGSSAVMDLELVRQSNETLSMKVEVLEKEVGDQKLKLVSEVHRRRGAEDQRDEVSKSKTMVENELSELRKICHKYEETVSDLNTEISHKENELTALKETLGDDSPLVDVAEVKAKLVNAEETVASLQSRVESLTLENNSLSRNLKEASSSLSTIHKERDDVRNRLQVLEAWFKEKVEGLRKAAERYEAEKNIRGKDKDDLVRMIEEKTDETRDLNQRIETLKQEFEETKQQHRNEIRALESKSHYNWLSLCQAERRTRDARKEAEFLRQMFDELNGEVCMSTLLTPGMVPLPLPDDSHSYCGLGEGYMPPPPLPSDEEREPHRPAPLGRLSPNNYSDLEEMLSPIRDGGDNNSREREDYWDRDAPRHNRRSPRGGWVDIQHDRDRDRGERHPRSNPKATSTRISQGFNL